LELNVWEESRMSGPAFECSPSEEKMACQHPRATRAQFEAPTFVIVPRYDPNP
jgi:hypothetical protein